MAACLLVVIGTGVVTAMFGMSMGLGAFIAGILLAETEYRREIEVTIEPFKGLLLGLFFVSIGASLDVSAVISDPFKIFRPRAWADPRQNLAPLGWRPGFSGCPRASPPKPRSLLAPGGEFAFVIITAAVAAKALPSAIGADVMIAVTLSMFLFRPWVRSRGP